MVEEGEASAADARLTAELDLLSAMYPSAISFSPRGREVKYVLRGGPATLGTGTLLLRLPDRYPEAGCLPDVLQANGGPPHGEEDLRSSTREAIAELNLAPGEEALDAIILAFRELLGSRSGSRVGSSKVEHSELAAAKRRRDEEGRRCKTVVVWLHHLLNTNKRKLALNPSSSSSASSAVSGLAKPGYPGFLVFSGPAAAVDVHVSDLRAQRWQAFQVRYDSKLDDGGGSGGDGGAAWAFEHGTGIREVESMSELARGISDPRHRELFLCVIGVK
ncbi:hypothetical protein DL764_007762 [Monosporascus ibericus]|uniref:RWD domain-containing protein n=1 Tax=Monosporascus ibericus TaxID=155417 RepID=A0A4Q4SZ79_9PEZI|nr:hypothetical protein DL764_007762 [Monosporascus ibericus]